MKYSKSTHKRMNLSTNNPSLIATIMTAILQLLPWWVAKTVFLCCSLLAIVIGVMVLVTM
ncbi:hypothetical protein [Paenibacillus silvisoli]|uniref:hypothetical protein n=1 Tax=Paenibacillus silvisoli TaxID=3110539 RepID=UPI0028056232|nr:hypothetical protein [Paenibacillus silvisoli]